MIAVDTNILVHAQREDSPHHARAAAALGGLASGRTPWAVPWPCLHELVAVLTHPRIYVPPTPMSVALAAVEALGSVPTLRLIGETADHAGLLAGLLRDAPGVVGPRVHDARIAAICLGHGVSELWSADRDFSWFPRLQVSNPLAG